MTWWNSFSSFVLLTISWAPHLPRNTLHHFQRKLDFLRNTRRRKTSKRATRKIEKSHVIFTLLLALLYHLILRFPRRRMAVAGRKPSGFPIPDCEKEENVVLGKTRFDGEQWRRNAIICLVTVACSLRDKKTSVTFRDPFPMCGAVRCLGSYRLFKNGGGETHLFEQGRRESMRNMGIALQSSLLRGCGKK